MEINYKVENYIAIISWNMTSSAMNVLNDISIPEFEGHLEKAYSDQEVKGIIITSEKNEFIADMFGKDFPVTSRLLMEEFRTNLNDD